LLLANGRAPRPEEQFPRSERAAPSMP
jgi:hypothetical protein